MLGQWNNQPRAELRYKGDDSVPMGASRSYEFTHIIPESWEWGDGGERCSIFDLHNWEHHDEGPSSSVPFQIFIVGDEYWFVTYPETQTNWNVVGKYKINRGVTTRFKINVDWWPDERGNIELWRDGALLGGQYNAPACRAESIIPYPKIGLYITTWPEAIKSRHYSITDFHVHNIPQGSFLPP